MSKNLLTIPVFLLCIFLIFEFSCNKKKEELNTWIGHYLYEEEPVKAIAGYSMGMVWKLSINRNNDTCQGVLAIDGQQTYIRLLTDIKGDTNKIAIVYNSVIDGSSENMSKGDTLFMLSKNSGDFETSWLGLEPRLLEKTDKKCKCFIEISVIGNN
jgi:hypothetical protein